MRDIGPVVTLQEAQKDIGLDAMAQLVRLQRWLRYGQAGPESLPDLKFRSAPSIITRSEAELFGLSMPRFAIRTYLGDAGSFVNARRLSVLKRHAAVQWSTRIRHPATRSDAKDGLLVEDTSPDYPTPKQVIAAQASAVVADCLLSPPQWLYDNNAKVHLVQTALHPAYGEAPETHALQASSYVRHMKLGGGLCAQAVCFMATTLRHEYAKGAHGVAEVTAVFENDDQSELVLGGMADSEIIAYLEKVGLGGVRQSPKVKDNDDIKLRKLEESLSSYIRSSCPIICAVDLGRMAGKASSDVALNVRSIKQDNEFAFEQNVTAEEFACHCVLIVGERVSADGKRQFVIHDPATMPYLLADIHQLIDVLPYTTKERRDQDQMYLIPVTPDKVKMPLLDVPLEDQSSPGNSARFKGQSKRGLIEITTRLLPFVDFSPYPSYSPMPPDHHFCLTTLGKLTQQTHDAEYASLSREAVQQLRRVASNLIENYHLDADHHCWVQIIQENTEHSIKPGIWIWDAQVEALTPEDFAARKEAVSKHRNLAAIAGLLLAHVIRNAKDQANRWKAYVRCEKRPPRDQDSALAHAPARNMPHRLTASLISSFTLKGINDAMKHWPVSPAPPACELYCFMQEDVSARLFNARVLKQIDGVNPTALRVLARVWDDPERLSMIETLAANVHKSVQPKDIKISCLASFLPELVQGDQDGCKAILTLIELASRLRRDWKHPIGTVELVCGSRITGLWPGEIQGGMQPGKVFVANRLGRLEAIERLIKALREPALCAYERKIKLAMELEPGPLFVLRDRDCLDDFLAELEKREKREPFWASIGLNLDMAHWKLARIELADLEQEEPLESASTVKNLSEHRLIKRIAHAHCSRHARGHYSDLVFNDRSCDDWLHVLVNHSRSGTFSQFVSIELEAVHQWLMVDQSVVHLTRALGVS